MKAFVDVHRFCLDHGDDNGTCGSGVPLMKQEKEMGAVRRSTH